MIKPAFAVVQKQCGTARVVAGVECEFLAVEFDLSSCPNAPKKGMQAATIRKCALHPVAIVESEGFRYEAALKHVKTLNGTQWSVGPIVQVRKNEDKIVQPRHRSPSAISAQIASPSEPAEPEKPSSNRVPATPVPTPTPLPTPMPAVLVSPPTSTPEKKGNGILDKLSLKGHFRTRLEEKGPSDYSSMTQDLILLRVRPSFTITPTENSSVVFEPQFAKTFGEVKYLGASTTTNSANITSGNTVDTELSVHQAYASYSPFHLIQFTLGRQVLSYGDERIIGGLDWNNIARSFDVFKIRLNYSLSWTDFFASKLSNNNTSSTSSDDNSFYGIYNHFNLGTGLQELEVYWLLLTTRNVSSPSDIHTFGIRAASKISSFDYKIEADEQIGVLSGSESYQADLDFGFQISSFFKRVGLEGFIAGRDYNQLFPTVHKFLGYADMLGRRNIMGAAVKTAFSIVDSVQFTLEYNYFLRTSTNSPAYQLNGTSTLGNGTASSSSQIGSEVDAVIKWDIDKHFGLEVGGCLFLPGSYLADQYNPTNVFFGYGQVMVKF